MASSSSRMDAFALIVPVFAPLTLGGAGYLAWKTNWQELATSFFMGPGRVSRILLLLFVVFNRKNMPFVWTFRVFSAILRNYISPSPSLGPRGLFKPMISTSHTPLLEIDYNLHKSNSTFFSDLDVSRSHLVSYLMRPALAKATHNAKSKLVLDPKTGKAIKGPLGILLGSVQCSFKKEVAPFKSYEMWSKIMCWDRKWLYIVTHFMPKGTAKPTEWLDPKFGKVRVRGPSDAAGDWEKKILATAISKYVFKVGRFTVNPAILLEDSGLLPERPGGWTSGENQIGDESVDLGDIDLSAESDWDWRRIEAQRRKSMTLADRFSGIDEAHALFDGGDNGALANVWPG